MENEVKVFHSDITRVECKEKNHLYDLLKIVPAKPIPQRPHNSRNETWEFTPNYSKHYIPREKKGSKIKVKTVRDIRTAFEKDIYCYLPGDLEKQQNYLLHKIRDGSSSEEKTKSTAKNLLNADTPISRSAWQMLVNINPEKHNHPKQFVLWNGKCIQVNGSRGGKTTFICNYDLKNNKNTRLNNTSNFKTNASKSRIGLLRNSLKVKFKPGPLGKKKFLDDSHHKYQMGYIELIKLPTPALEISPAYGTVLEPTISNYVNNLRGETGVISHKLAEFAVSVLGTVRNKTPAQLDKDSCITFDLNYKYNQNRLLMRQNTVETTTYKNVKNDSIIQNNHCNNESITMVTNSGSNCTPDFTSENGSLLTIDIKKIMDDILHSVEISINQDSIYILEDKSSGTIADECAENNPAKDKPKRKYCELGKLDVTVIKLPESSQQDYSKPCGKSFCTLGCICESLDCVFSLKQHCGVLDCMFGCKCEVSKYKDIELLERDCSEIIPGLLNLDNEINSHLAKEEQKFHQTVIVSGEKSILLKSQKRNCKSSKKYAEFYSKMNLKTDEKVKRILAVDVNRISCKNIEPFCMVHNLYKCFCKGKFTESSMCNITENNASNIEQTKLEPEINTDKNNDVKTALRSLDRKCYGKTKSIAITGGKDFANLCCYSDHHDDFISSSARTVGYSSRKYSDEYYKNTNNKILEMEQNDRVLRKKMLRLINGANEDVSPPDTVNISSEYLNNDEISSKTSKSGGEFSYPFSNVTGKRSLKDWLETSYRSYKERFGQGIIKNCLDTPKKGKAALQSWDFILSRYRERKNIFFISKQEPFRTFLAVDENNPFFTNCINIDDIRFADMHKYPLIIRNLVTNATDSENSFCILRGWDHCWELIGSAVKVIERVVGNQSKSKETFETDMTRSNDDSLDNENDDWVDKRTLFSHDNSASVQDNKEDKEIERDTHNAEKSKWFVMTVENDFTEIQFYKRGFYVTYAGIQRSICLARISGKTVRLSSQARTDKNSTHQFGIYAIPITNECCVFIGPYEVNEPLGIEVVKTFLDPSKQKKTRGVWITTNNVDNMKVIEHPLSFMPSVSIPSEAMVTLDSGANTSTNTKQLQTPNENNKKSEELSNLPKESEKEMTKIVKPIKIRRTNGFYHLSSKNILHKIPPNKASSLFAKKSIKLNSNPTLMKNPSSLLRKPDDLMSEESNLNLYNMTNLKPVAEIAPQIYNIEESSANTSTAYIRPVAEIAPQIKITSVYSESSLQTEAEKSDKSKGVSMLILKPEEINKKILAKPAVDDEISTDIERFLETSTICIAPQDEVYVISDGEDEDIIAWKDVWVQCRNVDNFGCIRGRINEDKLLSFEFPGFKYSEYYTESEAFDKINQVLARKIYMPEFIKLQWQVTENKEQLKCDILTPECLEEKKYLLIKLREQREKKGNPASKARKTGSIKTYAKNTTASISEDEPSKTKTETAKLLKGLEQTSRELENENELLWNEAVTRKNEILSTLDVPDDLKVVMTETLQDIMSMNT